MHLNVSVGKNNCFVNSLNRAFRLCSTLIGTNKVNNYCQVAFFVTLKFQTYMAGVGHEANLWHWESGDEGYTVNSAIKPLTEGCRAFFSIFAACLWNVAIIPPTAWAILCGCFSFVQHYYAVSIISIPNRRIPSNSRRWISRPVATIP